MKKSAAHRRRHPDAVTLSTLGMVSRAVVSCQRCPRLRAYCTRVAHQKRRQFLDQHYWGRPVPSFGDPSARLLIVGLAPAAHGANRTGRMFTGDSSGDWLYGALYQFGFSNQARSTSSNDGLQLEDCFIAAAARCAPPDNQPTAAELANCRGFLTAELALLKRVVVVLTLGRIGYEAWLKASGWWSTLPVSDRPAFGHGTESRLSDGTTLICSYHPSRQNTNTGRLTRRMWHAVFRRARSILDGRATREKGSRDPSARR